MELFKVPESSDNAEIDGISSLKFGVGHGCTQISNPSMAALMQVVGV